jgi:hypothetical protein
MVQRLTLTVNGNVQAIAVDDPDMPLLYALRDDLGLNNPRFGCGLGQCGACTVHIDGRPARSCVTPVSSVGPKAFTGGDLLLYDDAAPDGANTAGWFTRFLPVRNMALLFPSNRLHEVTAVLSTPDHVLAGRLAVNVWFAADEDKGDPA